MQFRFVPSPGAWAICASLLLIAISAELTYPLIAASRGQERPSEAADRILRAARSLEPAAIAPDQLVAALHSSDAKLFGAAAEYLRARGSAVALEPAIRDALIQAATAAAPIPLAEQLLLESWSGTEAEAWFAERLRARGAEPAWVELVLGARAYATVQWAWETDRIRAAIATWAAKTRRWPGDFEPAKLDGWLSSTNEGQRRDSARMASVPLALGQQKAAWISHVLQVYLELDKVELRATLFEALMNVVPALPSEPLEAALRAGIEPAMRNAQELFKRLPAPARYELGSRLARDPQLSASTRGPALLAVFHADGERAVDDFLDLLQAQDSPDHLRQVYLSGARPYCDERHHEALLRFAEEHPDPTALFALRLVAQTARTPELRARLLEEAGKRDAQLGRAIIGSLSIAGPSQQVADWLWAQYAGEDVGWAQVPMEMLPRFADEEEVLDYILQRLAETDSSSRRLILVNGLLNLEHDPRAREGMAKWLVQEGWQEAKMGPLIAKRIADQPEAAEILPPILDNDRALDVVRDHVAVGLAKHSEDARRYLRGRFEKFDARWKARSISALIGGQQEQDLAFVQTLIFDEARPMALRTAAGMLLAQDLRREAVAKAVVPILERVRTALRENEAGFQPNPFLRLLQAAVSKGSEELRRLAFEIGALDRQRPWANQMAFNVSVTRGQGQRLEPAEIPGLVRLAIHQLTVAAPRELRSPVPAENALRRAYLPWVATVGALSLHGAQADESLLKELGALPEGIRLSPEAGLLLAWLGHKHLPDSVKEVIRRIAWDIPVEHSARARLTAISMRIALAEGDYAQAKRWQDRVLAHLHVDQNQELRLALSAPANQGWSNLGLGFGNLMLMLRAEAGDPELRQALRAEARRPNPQLYATRLAGLQSAMHSGEWDLGRELAGGLVLDRPEDPEPRLLQAWMAAMQEDWEAAERHFAQAIRRSVPITEIGQEARFGRAWIDWIREQDDTEARKLLVEARWLGTRVCRRCGRESALAQEVLRWIWRVAEEQELPLPRGTPRAADHSD